MKYIKVYWYGQKRYCMRNFQDVEPEYGYCALILLINRFVEICLNDFKKVSLSQYVNHHSIMTHSNFARVLSEKNF